MQVPSDPHAAAPHAVTPSASGGALPATWGAVDRLPTQRPLSLSTSRISTDDAGDDDNFAMGMLLEQAMVSSQSSPHAPFRFALQGTVLGTQHSDKARWVAKACQLHVQVKGGGPEGRYTKLVPTVDSLGNGPLDNHMPRPTVRAVCTA